MREAQHAGKNNEALFSAHSAEAIIKVIRQVARSEKLELRASDGADLSLSGRSIVFLHRFETTSIPGPAWSLLKNWDRQKGESAAMRARGARDCDGEVDDVDLDLPNPLASHSFAVNRSE